MSAFSDNSQAPAGVPDAMSLKCSPVVFSTPWFAIEAESCDGEHPYYRMVCADGVVVLPVTDDGNLVVIRQWRPARKAWTVEFPAGMVDQGEDPAAAAERELREETGLRCRSLKRLMRGGLRLERESSCETYFLAEGVEPIPGYVVSEDISIEILNPEAFRRLVLADGFDHLAGLAALQVAEWKFGLRLGESAP